MRTVVALPEGEYEVWLVGFVPAGKLNKPPVRQNVTVARGSRTEITLVLELTPAH